MLGDLYGFPGPSKVPFSAFKVGVQENFHWCFVKENFGDFFEKNPILSVHRYLLSRIVTLYSF